MAGKTITKVKGGWRCGGKVYKTKKAALAAKKRLEY